MKHYFTFANFQHFLQNGIVKICVLLTINKYFGKSIYVKCIKTDCLSISIGKTEFSKCVAESHLTVAFLVNLELIIDSEDIITNTGHFFHCPNFMPSPPLSVVSYASFGKHCPRSCPFVQEYPQYVSIYTIHSC